MVGDANLYGSGFVSKAGERLAAVGQITNCSPSTICNQYLPYQVIFVPSSCPTCTGSVGDYVWKDLNGNGVQDAGEPGILGVPVNLSGIDDRGQSIELSTTTDASGKYQFSQLCTGTYTVTVDDSTLLLSMKPSGQSSSNGDDNIPNDSNLASGTTVTISNDSTSNLTVDFGYKPECGGSIGDYVWKDLDNNGFQNAGEPAFPGIIVNLTGTTVYGNPITLSTTTNINGMYSFTGLCQGDYRVTVDATTVPVSFGPTLSTSANGDDGVANDSNVSTGTSVYLPNDMSPNANVDFGYIPKCSGSIGDYVWKDLNENGQQDIDEPGIPGVEVSLSGTNSYAQLVSMQASTDETGKYSFPGICDGSYTVTINPSTVPLGLIPTEPLSGNGSDLVAKDSNNPAGTSLILSGDSAVNATIDFGYVPFCSGTLGDTVWNDLNGNGVQDDGSSSGINGVEVLLTGTSDYGQPVNLSKTTMNGGFYQFTDLCKGTYTVAINAGSLPSGAVPTSPLSANGNDMVPQDSNNPIGTTVVFSNDSSSNPTVDFGYYLPAMIGDGVWVDINNNGIQDGGEVGLANVNVTLFNCTTQDQVKVTTTDGAGFYNFSVEPGSYYVMFEAPDHFFYTTKNAIGSTVANDSNASMNGITDCLTVESGEKNLTVDAGLYTSPVSATCVSITAVQGVAITPVSMTANGGTGAPYSYSATGLPDGITMSPSGTISGTPIVSGTFSYTVTVKDSAGNIGTFNCTVTVNPPVDANCVMITAVQDKAITPVTMAASGGMGGYTFIATGLPAGLTMATDGTISGTPTVTGTFNYTVTITDKENNVGSINCSVTVNPPVSANCVMITAVQGVAIKSVAMGASGGVGPYTFSSSGLPAGITMSATGIISGTPTVSGTFNYTVTVKDSAGNIGTFNCSVTVNPPVSANCMMIAAVQGVAITPVTMIASGGMGGNIFSATGLPAGITMATDGTISGTPTVSGTFNYTVTVTDKDDNVGSIDCSVTVNPPVSANCVMITAVQGVAITPVTMDVSGGTGAPYTFSATGLPAGITMSANGTISGTPTVSGTFNYTVTVTDKDDNVGSIDCSVTVNPPVSANCVMITTVQGVAITPVAMIASGGTGTPYTYSATGLPAGITMSANGTISGTPTVSGPFSYTVTVMDKDGNVGTSNCSVVVNPPVSVTCISITAVQGVAITPVAMTASGGTGAPYTYSATGLPAGITMSSTGIISGTPTVSGTFSYTVTAKDKDGNVGTSNCSVVVNPPPVCIPCKEGVKQMTLALNWRTSSGDPKERIRVHADNITGAILFDTWSDSNPSTGLPVGSNFTFNVPLTAKSVIVTVQGANDRKETMKATFSAECDLVVGQTSVNTYITFKVMDVVLDGDIACGGGYAGIGDYVWIDANKDGIQDMNEAGSAGVTVKLFSCGGTIPLATATTGADGKYLFASLEPGDYSLQFMLPSGYFFTPKDEGLLDTIDSDADTTTGSTVCTTLLAGENDLSWDAGIKKISTSTGCSYTIGYWKNHTGVGPQADVVTPLLPQYLGTQGGAKTISVTTVKMADDILSQAVYGTSSNGITKLYAQLLAAKLNLKAGADSTAVNSIIAAADNFLASKNYNDWSSLSSSNVALVASWHDTLDDYNNGLIGPGHCGSQEVVPCVSIDKKISIDGGKSWLDADTQATAAARSATTTVYYKLIVQNCGQVDLADVSVNDPALGVSNYLISSLSAGISKTLTYSQIPKLKVYNQCTVAGAFENVATAVADYKGLVVTASDSAWLVCNVTSTCVDIIKDISVDGGSTWKTADSQTTAPTVAAPHNAYYRLTVKNCGSNSLSNVVVKDEELGISSYTIGNLSAGASKVLTSKQVSKLYDSAACTTSGMFLNTAIVIGMYGTKTVTDADVAWLVCTSTTTGGCSYTQGYWKTHTIYDGAKKRNSTWDKVGGENQLFFKTGQTWYEALMSEPATGNAYYILAHQYIAATLNKLSGADAAIVDVDLKNAALLLDKYDGFPSKMEDISGSIREDFITTASRLDQYNNGIIGPGHCK